ncbi:MAG: hypothetical protein M0Z61_17050 [Nitrospiraceae bacterium]|nr:hypothetical protein [Nitrospiraceae bacterium]
MKKWILLTSLVFLNLAHFAIVWPVWASSQTIIAQKSVPGKDAKIQSYEVLETDGSLYVSYSDGTSVKIPPEKGNVAIDNKVFEQQDFEQIQIARDCRHIGWLATYMSVLICSQSYPCVLDLAIYRYGRKMVYISPPDGEIWSWSFWAGGKEVAMHYGFPHGDDTGSYALYDSESGREIAHYNPKDKEAPGPVPGWARQLQ